MLPGAAIQAFEGYGLSAARNGLPRVDAFRAAAAGRKTRLIFFTDVVFWPVRAQLAAKARFFEEPPRDM